MPVPCFLLFLVSEISTRKISSESDEIFSSINKSSGSFRSPEGTWGGAPSAPHHRWARHRVGPRRAMVWWPHQAPDAHPSPISTPRRVNPNTKHNIPQKVPSRPSSSISDRGSSDVLSAPCRRGNHHRGFYIIMPASRVMRE